MLVGLLSVAAALAWSIGFPVASPLVVGLLLASAAAVWWRPSLALTLCLAATPSLALAPWSGRLYIDELDALFAVLLGVAYWRSPAARHSNRQSDTTLRVLWGAVTLAVAVGVVRALWPWQTIGPDALADLSAPINALRIAKGAWWAACGLTVMNRLRRGGVDIRPAAVNGLLGGLVLTLAVIAWERITFPGLLDVASAYRVTGPFAEMNVSGGQVETFLVVAAPFLALAFLRASSLGVQLSIALLAGALAYGVMVAFSHSGHAAFAVAGLITVAIWSLGRRASTASRLSAVAWLAVMLASAAPLLFGSFPPARWTAMETDMATRMQHWETVLRLREPDSATSWFGRGLGQFADVHSANSFPPLRRGNYRLVRDGDNTLLRLGAGHPVHVEQFVDLQPGKRYALGIDVRSQEAQSVLRLSVCERWMLTSFNCIDLKASGSDSPKTWKHQELAFDTGRFVDGPWYARRPIKLAITTPESGLTLDVARLTLHAEDGRNLVTNGDFAQGFDHWYFSADNPLAWRTESLPLGLLFDLGWFGVLAFGLLIATALIRSARHAWQGDDFAAASLAALSGFLVLGLFNTLVDGPRFLFLLLLLCGMAARRPSWRPRASKG